MRDGGHGPAWGRIQIQLNPAIAFFKGLVKIMLYIEVLFIANIKITMKTVLGTKVYMLYWRNYVKSGCSIAGFHCIYNIDLTVLTISIFKRIE